MKACTSPSKDLDRLPLSQRNLVEQVENACNQDQQGPFLAIAEMRLRNIIENYSDALKRARLAVRSGGTTHEIADLQCRLDICKRALETCRRKIAALGDGG